MNWEIANGQGRYKNDRIRVVKEGVCTLGFNLITSRGSGLGMRVKPKEVKNL